MFHYIEVPTLLQKVAFLQTLTLLGSFGLGTSSKMLLISRPQVQFTRKSFQDKETNATKSIVSEEWDNKFQGEILCENCFSMQI